MKKVLFALAIVGASMALASCGNSAEEAAKKAIEQGAKDAKAVYDQAAKDAKAAYDQAAAEYGF